MNFIVTLHDSARSRIDEIAVALQKMGNKVDRKLKITGIIVGSTGNKIGFSDLEKIEGVKKVEKERAVSIRNR